MTHPRNNVLVNMMIGLGLIGLVALALAGKAVAWHGECYQDSHGTWWHKVTSDSPDAQYIDGGWWVVSTPQCVAETPPVQTPPTTETPAPTPAPATAPSPPPSTPVTTPVVAPSPPAKHAAPVCVVPHLGGTLAIDGPTHVGTRAKFADLITVRSKDNFRELISLVLRPQTGRLTFAGGRTKPLLKRFVLNPGQSKTIPANLRPTIAAIYKNVTFRVTAKIRALGGKGIKLCGHKPLRLDAKFTSFEPPFVVLEPQFQVY